MEPTYTILGGDGNQYGPVSADQLRAWAREGRIDGGTQVLRNDHPEWVAAATLPELGLAAAPPVTSASAAIANEPSTADLVRRMKGGASWFYWIAGFSLVNSVFTATGSQWGFAIGLGITSSLDRAALQHGGAIQIAAIVLALLAGGIVALFGYLAGKGHLWAFIVGMILLGIDTAITGLAQMWISFAFHLFALFCIYAGFNAGRALNAAHRG